ncbi:MAG: hypothetical protein ACTH0V_00515 [Microbacteriaceae bacterium]
MSDLEALYNANKPLFIASATAAAGPGASKDEIADRVRVMLELHAPGSPLDSVLYAVNKRIEETGEIKYFTGTVIHLDKEESSQRAVVVLQTGSTQGTAEHALGQEVLRTDRLDGSDVAAQEAARIANQVQGADGNGGLIGHKVTVTVGVVQKGTMKYRTLTGIRDNGPDPEYNPGDPKYRLHPAVSKKVGTWARASQMQLG